MIRYIRLAILSVFALLLVSAGSNVLYVQSSKAKIMKSPSFKSKVVTTAKRGHKLTVVSKKGRWYEVKSGSKTGWVSRLLVSKRPPLKKVSVFAKANKRIISRKARRRASVMTTAAAARGLAEDDRRRLGAETKNDYAALERVEAINVTEAEVESFADSVQ